MTREPFHVELARLEVRCCCNPARVYGTLPIRANQRHVGARIHLGAFERVESLPLTRVLEHPEQPAANAYTVRLVVEVCHDPERGRPQGFLALKYEDEEL